MNNTFRDCMRLQLKGQHQRLTGCPWHLNGHNSVNPGIIKMKQNLNVRNSYSYVATATMIWFHFQFPRSPDAALLVVLLFVWLFNWKCKFSCRIISNIANYLKYNYFWDVDAIDNVTLRLWKFSDFCSRHTVGIAGDDIMFHILVCLFVCLSVCLCLSRCLSGWFNYEGLVSHKQYFAGVLLEISSCASYVSRTHDVIDGVTRWQSRSKFEIDISPSIFELKRRSKGQNVGNANGYLSDIFNFQYNFRWKSELKMAAIFKILKY